MSVRLSILSKNPFTEVKGLSNENVCVYIKDARI